MPEKKIKSNPKAGCKAIIEEPFVKPDSDRVKKVIEILEKTHPESKTALEHSNALEMLVATILSAQTTDKQVNKVTNNLFKKYTSVKDYADASVDELNADIGSVNFHYNKAKNIVAMAKMIISEYGGEIPRTLAELVKLPGVARKTANVVMGSAFGITEGIAVDTHVLCVSARLGFSNSTKNAEVTERQLMEIIPRDLWIWISHALIDHGREICTSRKPKCEICPLNKICPSAFKV